MGRILLLICCVVALACGSDSSTPTAPSGPLFSRTGVGNTVFDLPSQVQRLKIHGTYAGAGTNFIVWCGAQLVVNELLGTSFGPITYDGTHLIQSPGCALEIRNSTGVAWTITEVR